MHKSTPAKLLKSQGCANFTTRGENETTVRRDIAASDELQEKKAKKNKAAKEQDRRNDEPPPPPVMLTLKTHLGEEVLVVRYP